MSPTEWIAITDRVAAGESYEAATQWARTTLGVNVTVRSVMHATAARRGDVDARTVARRELATDLPSDLDALDDIAKRVRKIARRAERDGAIETALKACDIERRVLHSKLHFAGVDQPDVKAEAEASPRKAAELVREAFGLVGPKADDTPHGAN